MFKKVYILINKMLQIIGLQLVRYKNISDFRGKGLTPLTAKYLSDGAPCLVLYPINKLRIGFFFSCKGEHIYEVALRSYMQSNELSSIKNIIGKYSQLVQFDTANDSLGLSISDGVFEQDDTQFATPFPWDNRNKKEMESMRSQNIIKENKKRGGGGALVTLNNNTTDEIVISESNTLKTLFQSFKKDGYKETEDYISIDLLLGSTAYVAYVVGGNHRVAVMAALGYEKIPVLLRKIVRREDVEHWPNVVNGLYSKEAALKVFDRIFNAEPPPVFDKWLEYVGTEELE